MTTSQTARETAGTIIQQLGGNRFIAMTGAKNFVCGTNDNGNDFAAFKVGRNAGKVSYVRIVLNSMDLYDMEFLNIRNFECKTIAKCEGLYNDMLQDTFTQVTGMYTSL